ncbi:MAG: endonuclease [Prevotellaceae bacterium]|jgi:endonuclease I|nr:endonuclease [Prevotellaceae bacterium]
MQNIFNHFFSFPFRVKGTKLTILALVSSAGAHCLLAQAPPQYYDAAKGKSEAALKTALHNIIKKDHTERTYANLWDDFKITDRRTDSTVWDMYSSCTFTFAIDQCVTYKNVCDCYTREHSFPKSWFSNAKPMYTDIFHLYPTDGYVNGRRSNYPFGEVGSVTWSNSQSKGKVGKAKSELGYTGVVFEPDDEYKGDFARTYFYMVTRYEDKVAGWYSNEDARPTLDGTPYPALSSWTKTMLLKWHRQDPVSIKETDRNNVIYSQIQHNRNPFIDHPELAEYIWGDSVSVPWGAAATGGEEIAAAQTSADFNFKLYPNPASTKLALQLADGVQLCKVEALDMTGTLQLLQKGNARTINVSALNSGEIYVIRITTSKGIARRLFCVVR